MHNEQIHAGFLRCCETGLVDTIVDSVVDPAIQFIDLLSQGLGVEIKLFLVLRQEAIESIVEHANNLGTFVIYCIDDMHKASSAVYPCCW